jgi:hypothetical protein
VSRIFLQRPERSELTTAGIGGYYYNILRCKGLDKISKVCPKKVEEVNIHKASVYVQIINSNSQEWLNNNMYVCRISNYWAVGLDGNIII